MQVPHQVVLCRNLLVKFEVVYEAFLSVRKHFFVIVPFFGEKPFEVGHLLPGFDLLPNLSRKQNFPNQVFIIVGLGNQESAVMFSVLQFVRAIDLVDAC